MKGAALYELVLGDRTDERLRSAAINLAIAGFLIHVVACTLHGFSLLDIAETVSYTHLTLPTICSV